MLCFTNSGCFLCANIQSCFLTPPPLPRLLCSISQTGCISLPCLEWNAEKERESTRWAEGGVEVGLCTKPKFDSLVHCRQGAEPLLSSFLSCLVFFFFSHLFSSLFSFFHLHLMFSFLHFSSRLLLSSCLFWFGLRSSFLFLLRLISALLVLSRFWSSCFVSSLLVLSCLLSSFSPRLIFSRLVISCLVSSFLIFSLLFFYCLIWFLVLSHLVSVLVLSLFISSLISSCLFSFCSHLFFSPPLSGLFFLFFRLFSTSHHLLFLSSLLSSPGYVQSLRFVSTLLLYFLLPVLCPLHVSSVLSSHLILSRTFFSPCLVSSGLFFSQSSLVLSIFIMLSIFSPLICHLPLFFIFCLSLFCLISSGIFSPHFFSSTLSSPLFVLSILLVLPGLFSFCVLSSHPACSLSFSSSCLIYFSSTSLLLSSSFFSSCSLF